MRRRLDRSAQQAPHAEANRAQSPPHEQLLARERLTAVHRAVQDLPELHRTVFLLRHYHGLCYQDISAILQCPLGTVTSRRGGRQALCQTTGARGNGLRAARTVYWHQEVVNFFGGATYYLKG